MFHALISALNQLPSGCSVNSHKWNLPLAAVRISAVFIIVVYFVAGCDRASCGVTKAGVGAPGGTGVARNTAVSAARESIDDTQRLQSHGAVKLGFDRVSTDTNWSIDLATGANGPIPKIVVDQFGYRTGAVKIAVIRDPQTGYDKGAGFSPGTHYEVVSKSSGATVMHGIPIPWGHGAIDKSSGDKVWWFEFSQLVTPGTYFVRDVDKNVRSVEFDINDQVYRSVLAHAVRTFYYQRAGFAKTAEAAGSNWADSASHLGAGQDSQARSWLNKGDATQVKDLRGGWFDAGDYNKYTNWTARNIIVLLLAFEEAPTAFGDDLGISESGNGTPDLLDEVKWGLDWLVRMQNTDGSLLCVQGLASGRPPSVATGPSYYGPATTSASLMGASAFAYASKVYAARSEPELQAYGASLLVRARSAWAWAMANSKVIYYNNDAQTQPGSQGLAAGQQEMDETGRGFAKFEAAVYLYERTGDASYKSHIEASYQLVLPSTAPNQWDTDRQEALLYMAKLPAIAPNVKSAIIDRFIHNMLSNADQLPMVVGQTDPYRAAIKDYTWGSNKSKAMQSRLYQLLASHAIDSATIRTAEAAAEDYIHYIHGVNPLGLVYLTNMKCSGAEHSAKTMFHNWFADGDPQWDETTITTPGPPPGYLVGGPNPAFSLDSCCTAPLGTIGYRCYGAKSYALCKASYEPPLNQPAQKSYLQFNAGWPANSWSITEPSTGYQAQYIRVLARYAL